MNRIKQLIATLGAFLLCVVLLLIIAALATACVYCFEIVTECYDGGHRVYCEVLDARYITDSYNKGENK